MKVNKLLMTLLMLFPLSLTSCNNDKGSQKGEEQDDVEVDNNYFTKEQYELQINPDYLLLGS